MWLSNLFMVFMSILICGCSTPFNVTVDSISSPIAIEKNKFIIIPGNKDVDENNLQYAEFSAYTEKVLESIGFEKVSNPEDADVGIFLSYGVSDPKFYEYTYSTPIWGQTGVAQSNTYGSVTRYGNCATYSQNTTYTPQYGVIGSQTNVGVGVVYFRNLTLEGVDLEKFRENGKVYDLWKTAAISNGESGDLRYVFPYMLVASKNFIRTNSLQKVNIQIAKDNHEVEELKKSIQ
ncbi:hypothetical protein [Estrella lausannensis]|uniref:DUF4136 domain-containing protein n=1 Tax=Estrella lausannensis TaxID=483423 RepID=A0A0H5DNM4_9BACT|nr:hypothetical protein [Estrella lausannensis]CRX37966.1 hypothetical protein ELAC_0611 [Estrella lausannensis]